MKKCGDPVKGCSEHFMHFLHFLKRLVEKKKKKKYPYISPHTRHVPESTSQTGQRASYVIVEAAPV